ncbi:MAG: hypothetical protein QQN63_07200 [Nitrosopumilus sp.]
MTRQEKLDDILTWKSSKPTTDADWAEDVKKESFDLKYSHQLEEMLVAHEKKIPVVQEDLDKFNDWPDAVKYELNQQFSDPDFDLEGKIVQQWIDDEFAEQHVMYKWKVAKLEQTVERLKKEIQLRGNGFLTVLEKQGKNDKRFNPNMPENEAINRAGGRVRAPLGTQFFVDDTCATPGNGSSATCGGVANDPFDDLVAFTETGRNAGDICTVRRDNTSIDDGTDLLFTSDGTIDNPIIIEADYDNNFSGNVDLSATATATLTFGSKTVTFASDISGVLAVGDWIYAASDSQDDFAYEVSAVSTVTVTLFLPYKGAQAGSGKTMTNMQAAPKWNTAAGDFQWNFDGDNYWLVKGIHIRGTDANGNVEVDSSTGHLFKDVIFEGNGANDAALAAADDNVNGQLLKCRFYNHRRQIRSLAGGSNLKVLVDSCLLDGNSVSGSEGFGMNFGDNVTVSESELKNHTSTDATLALSLGHAELRSRNSLFSSSTPFFHANGPFASVLLEDRDGVLGDTRQFTGFSVTDGTPVLQSDTGTIRSGGSNVSIKVTPSTELSTNWEISRLKLFEIPFYATTDSKKYEIFFRPTATTDWTADPTAAELWIELEYWGHASNNFRRITKSTGVIDMNGSTTFTALSVTVAPSQAGVAYLRCYYAKTKESSKANTFFVDPIPVVT